MSSRARAGLRRMRLRRRHFVVAALLAALPWVLLWITRRPSNDRDWRPNDAVLPYAEFEGDRVHIRNIRNTVYTTTEIYTPAYYDKTFELDRLLRVWFVVEPFSEWDAVAHTFLSFEFEGPEFVAISVEARKERGETYHFLKGLFRQYELMYLVADERDVIRLRTNYRGDDVYLYPIRAPRERVRELFVAMLERINRLRERPEFYNTVTANCTNTIVQHINRLFPGKVPPSLGAILPGYADRLAYDLGWIDTDLPFEAAREHFRINERALRYGDEPDFSVKIREREDVAAAASENETGT